MPVAISPRAPRSSTVHSAVASRAWTAWVLGPAAAGGGGTANVLSSGVGGRAASSHPPLEYSFNSASQLPASSSLLDSSSHAGRGGSRGGRGSSAVHCIGMRRTNQCDTSRPSLVLGKGLSDIYLAVFGGDSPRASGR